MTSYQKLIVFIQAVAIAILALHILEIRKDMIELKTQLSTVSNQTSF